MEYIYKIDPEIYDDEILTFGSNPPDEWKEGGDTFFPNDYKWKSGVHRISEKQFSQEGLRPFDTDAGLNINWDIGLVNKDSSLYFFKYKEHYFAVGGDTFVFVNLERHFKTRFKA